MYVSFYHNFLFLWNAFIWSILSIIVYKGFLCTTFHAMISFMITMGMITLFHQFRLFDP